MATVTVTAHHNSSWEQKNGKWVKTKKAPTTHKVEVNDFGGPLYGEGIHRAFKKQHPEAAKTAERLEYKKDLKESIRSLVEGAIKDLETKDEEEKRLLKTNKPKKIMTDKERSQFKGLQKKDLKEGLFSGNKSLKPTKAGIKRALQKDAEENSGPSGDDYQPTKKGIKLIKRLTNEGVLSNLKNRVTGRRLGVKLKLANKRDEYDMKTTKHLATAWAGYEGARWAKNKDQQTAMFKNAEREENASKRSGVVANSLHRKMDNLSKTKNYFTGKGRVDEGAMLKALGNRVKANLKADAHDAKEAILKAGPKIGAAAEKGLIGLGKAGKNVVQKTIYPTMYKHLQRVNEGAGDKWNERLKAWNDEAEKDRVKGKANITKLWKQSLANSNRAITPEGKKLVTDRIKNLQKEGFTRTLDKVSGNQKRRIKKKLKHQNSMVSTPLSKIYTNNKRLQRLGN